MNDRTNALTKEFRPELAIIVYNDGNDDFYLESHDFNEAGKVLEGKPLKQETIASLVDFFYNERKSHSAVAGVMPDNLLRFDELPGGQYFMAWYCPAEQRVLHFVEDLHIPSGLTWLPGLVFTATGDKLHVYALHSSERPQENTQLYHAPFHNVSSSGSVCLGNARVNKPDKKTFASLIKYWEDMFFMSEFTHLAGGENPTEGNLSTIWRTMIQEQRSFFPREELKAHKGLTLEKVMR